MPAAIREGNTPKTTEGTWTADFLSRENLLPWAMPTKATPVSKYRVNFCGTVITRRTFEILKWLGVCSWADLSHKTAVEVLRCPDCSGKTLRMLAGILETHNLRFRQPVRMN
jgi:hypothetical protein